MVDLPGAVGGLLQRFPEVEPLKMFCYRLTLLKAAPETLTTVMKLCCN